MNLIQADETDRVVERKEIPLFDNKAFREAFLTGEEREILDMVINKRILKSFTLYRQKTLKNITKMCIYCRQCDILNKAKSCFQFNRRAADAISIRCRNCKKMEYIRAKRKKLLCPGTCTGSVSCWENLGYSCGCQKAGACQ